MTKQDGGMMGVSWRTLIGHAVVMTIPAAVLALAVVGTLRTVFPSSFSPEAARVVLLVLFFPAWYLCVRIANFFSLRSSAKAAALAARPAAVKAAADARLGDIAIHAVPLVGAGLGLVLAQWLNLGPYGHVVMALLAAGGLGYALCIGWGAMFHASKESVTINAIELPALGGTRTKYSFDYEAAQDATPTNHEPAIDRVLYISIWLIGGGLAFFLAGIAWSVFMQHP